MVQTITNEDEDGTNDNILSSTIYVRHTYDAIHSDHTSVNVEGAIASCDSDYREYREDSPLLTSGESTSSRRSRPVARTTAGVGIKRSISRSLSRTRHQSEAAETPSFSIWTLSRAQKVIMVITCAADLLAFLSISLMAPFFPEEALKKDVSDTLSGWIFGISPFIQFVSSPIIGKLMPFIGVKFLFISGMFMFSGCTILIGFLTYVPTDNGNGVFIALAFLLQIFKSIGTAGVSNASFVLFVQEFPDNIATMFGIGEVFVGLGLVAGPAVGGLLYGLGGFLLPFVTIGGISMAFIPLVWWGLPPEIEFVDNVKDRTSMWKVFCSPLAFLTSVSIVISTYMWSILDPTLEPYLRKFNLSPEIIGVLFLVMAASYSMSAPVWGWVSDKFDEQRLLLSIGFLFAALGSLLIGPSPLVQPLGLDPDESELWMVVLALVILGASASLSSIPTFDMFFTFAEDAGCEDDTKTYSTVAGWWMAMYSLGDFLGPSIGGFMLDEVGFNDMCTYTSGVCVLMSILHFVSWLCDRKCCKCSRNKRRYSKLTDTYDQLKSECYGTSSETAAVLG